MKAKKRGVQAEVHHQEIDTNVFVLRMNTLKEDQVALATGDPVFCKECKAIFNVHSKIVEESKEQQVWQCEFCNNKNEVELEEEEIPSADTINYVLEAAA